MSSHRIAPTGRLERNFPTIAMGLRDPIQQPHLIIRTVGMD
jgi:hypothetical protein